MLAGAILSVALLSAASAAQGGAAQGEPLARSQALITRGAYREAEQVLAPLRGDTALTLHDRAWLDQQLAAVHSQTGAADQALMDADRAESEARAAGASDLLAKIEGVRGVVWLYRGKSAAALQHLNASLSWAQKSGNGDLTAIAYTRLAVAYQDLGDPTRGLDALNRCSEQVREMADAARLQYLTRRGLIEAELHEAGPALAHIREALDLARRNGDRRSEAQVQIDLARTLDRFAGDPKEAISSAREAVRMAREIQVPVLEIAADNQLGTLLRKIGRFDEARLPLEEGLALVRRFSQHRDEPYVLKNLGQVLIHLGLTARGEDLLREAASRADSDNLTRIRWVARIELAQLHAAHDPAIATREFEDALAILEEQQTNVLLEGFRAGALDETIAEFDPYGRYIDFLMERGDGAKAFYVAERQRARALLDTLNSNRDALARQVPPGFADSERSILGGIKTAQARLRTGAIDDQQRNDVLAEIGALESRLSRLRLRLAEERPELAHARYPKLWQVSELQSRLLRDDEALLGVYLGHDRSFEWIVTRKHLSTIVLSPKSEIEGLAGRALQVLRNPQQTDRSSLEALSSALAVDAITSAARASTHLIVIPNGVLHAIPFEALTDRHGHALIERFAISYAPSASSLAFLRLLRPAADAQQPTLLAVANPVVTTKSPIASRQVDLAHVDLLAPVPETLAEAREIARIFGRQARVLEGAAATRTLLQRSGMNRARILHFATHGLIDDVHPDRSGLVLTAEPPSDDGLLQVRDVYALHLDADLVTLSACETALGQNVTGEGVLGLTRAFFYAGARSVVASLWDVDDASTAKFMRSFYANVRNGEPIDTSLQHAKLELLRGGGPASAPFYWAAFVVNGQARGEIEVAPSWPVRTIAAAATLAALLIVVLWWRRPFSTR